MQEFKKKETVQKQIKINSANDQMTILFGFALWPQFQKKES